MLPLSGPHLQLRYFQAFGEMTKAIREAESNWEKLKGCETFPTISCTSIQPARFFGLSEIALGLHTQELSLSEPASTFHLKWEPQIQAASRAEHSTAQQEFQ